METDTDVTTDYLLLYMKLATESWFILIAIDSFLYHRLS